MATLEGCLVAAWSIGGLSLGRTAIVGGIIVGAFFLWGLCNRRDSGWIASSWDPEEVSSLYSSSEELSLLPFLEAGISDVNEHLRAMVQLQE